MTYQTLPEPNALQVIENKIKALENRTIREPRAARAKATAFTPSATELTWVLVEFLFQLTAVKTQAVADVLVNGSFIAQLGIEGATGNVTSVQTITFPVNAGQHWEWTQVSVGEPVTAHSTYT